LEAAEVGRRIVISTFLLMASAVALEMVRAFGHALATAELRPWLEFAYTALKGGLIAAFTILVIRRGPARRRVWNPLALAACAAAMLTAVFQQPAASTSTAIVLAGETLAVLAAACMIFATLALGRCFGVLPEARGLVTHGPYRFVRHPLYLGEFNLCAGLVLASPSTRNLVLAGIFAIAQTLRMRMEEHELTAHFPEYADYARQTRRLIPILPASSWAARPVRSLGAEEGQALIEYAFITALVSIAGFVVLGLIGGVVNVDVGNVLGGF
jgi:protein-S-isoprenylcysteine O-methyltransferase Ste14